VQSDARLFLSLEARDPSIAALVYELRNFQPQDVAFGMRYADAVVAEEDGSTVMDLDLISGIEPDDPKHHGAGGLV